MRNTLFVFAIVAGASFPFLSWNRLAAQDLPPTSDPSGASGGGAAAGLETTNNPNEGTKVIIRRPIEEFIEIQGVKVKANSIVVAKKDAVLRLRTVAKKLDAGHTVKVRKVSEGWMWVQGAGDVVGWIHNLDVIPFEIAVDDIKKMMEQRSPSLNAQNNGPGGTAAEAYARGDAALRAGSFDAAIEQFTAVINENPEVSLAYSARGDAQLGKKLYDKAIEDFTLAISKDDKNHVAYYNRGFAFHMKGNHDNALRDYDMAVEISPGEAWYYLQRGLCWYEKGEKKKAYEDHEMFVKNKVNTPTNVVAPTPTVAVTSAPVAGPTPVINAPPEEADDDKYWSPEELDEAIENFSKAIVLNADFALAYNGRGWAKYRKKQFAEAAKDFDQAILLTEQAKVREAGGTVPEETTPAPSAESLGLPEANETPAAGATDSASADSLKDLLPE